VKYYTPRNTGDLSLMLSDLPHESTSFIAGGTDMMPSWEQETSSLPNHLVDLKKIAGLSGIHESGDEITIGTLTTVQDIQNSELIQTKFTALSEAANQFAGVQIRNRATVGGNICNASPAGDLLPGLYAHNAVVSLVGHAGERQMPIGEFITGPGETKLQPLEILTSISLPIRKKHSLFYKLGLRQSMAISVVNFAIVYEINSDGLLKSLKVIAGAVAPTVVTLDRFSKAVVEGKDLDEAIELVDENIAPINDIRATAEYRSKALKNVLRFYIRNELVAK